MLSERYHFMNMEGCALVIKDDNIKIVVAIKTGPLYIYAILEF